MRNRAQLPGAEPSASTSLGALSQTGLCQDDTDGSVAGRVAAAPRAEGHSHSPPRAPSRSPWVGGGWRASAARHSWAAGRQRSRSLVRAEPLPSAGSPTQSVRRRSPSAWSDAAAARRQGHAAEHRRGVRRTIDVPAQRAQSAREATANADSSAAGNRSLAGGLLEASSGVGPATVSGPGLDATQTGRAAERRHRPARRIPDAAQAAAGPGAQPARASAAGRWSGVGTRGGAFAVAPQSVSDAMQTGAFDDDDGFAPPGSHGGRAGGGAGGGLAAGPRRRVAFLPQQQPDQQQLYLQQLQLSEQGSQPRPPLWAEPSAVSPVSSRDVGRSAAARLPAQANLQRWETGGRASRPDWLLTDQGPVDRNAVRLAAMSAAGSLPKPRRRALLGLDDAERSPPQRRLWLQQQRSPSVEAAAGGAARADVGGSVCPRARPRPAAGVLPHSLGSAGDGAPNRRGQDSDCTRRAGGEAACAAAAARGSAGAAAHGRGAAADAAAWQAGEGSVAAWPGDGSRPPPARRGNAPRASLTVLRQRRLAIDTLRGQPADSSSGGVASPASSSSANVATRFAGGSKRLRQARREFSHGPCRVEAEPYALPVKRRPAQLPGSPPAL